LIASGRDGRTIPASHGCGEDTARKSRSGNIGEHRTRDAQHPERFSTFRKRCLAESSIRAIAPTVRSEWNRVARRLHQTRTTIDDGDIEASRNDDVGILDDDFE
jgi:hypothetical protein